MSKMMCQFLKQQSTLDLDIDIFSETPMCFHYFMAMFNEIVGKKMNVLSDAMGMAKTAFISQLRLDLKLLGNCSPRDMVNLTESYVDVYQKFQNILVKLEKYWPSMCWIHQT